MYRINEIFYTLQGEGRHTGRAAVFVRFSGCNLRCPFCDTRHDAYTEMSAADIVCAVTAYAPCRFVVLTGGEPALQVDAALVAALKQANCYLAIETNGTHPLPAGIDWVTLSPKSPYLPAVAAAQPVLRQADELKLVFDGRPVEDFPHITVRHRYLQPCDTGQPEQNRRVLEQCVDYIKQHPQWTLSLQTHKLINIP